MKFLQIILAFSPSFLHVFIRRVFLKQQIEKNVKLKFGTLIISKKLYIGNQSKIGPFTYIKGQDTSIGEHSSILPLVLVSSRINQIGNYVTIKSLSVIRSDFRESSKFSIGDHSMVFPFCWIDTGKGVEIGSQSGIGGHTLIFTHGVWANYLKGGPISYGSVKIGNNVWLPWRVFIMPGVEIGDNVIVGANSLINKSIESNSLVAGSPAKKIKPLEEDISLEEKNIRIIEILEAYSELKLENGDSIKKINPTTIQVNDIVITTQITEIKSKSDLLLSMSKFDHDIKCGSIVIDDSVYHKSELSVPEHQKFINFLRGYGVRLYKH